MKKQLIFLGIETSCDETAASIVREDCGGNAKILSNVVSSQIEEHKEFGGVVPEIAARAHVEKIVPVATIINTHPGSCLPYIKKSTGVVILFWFLKAQYKQ